MTLEIQHSRSLASLNTLGLKVTAEHLAIARSESDVQEALAEARRQNWSVTVLGGGSNVVFRGDVPGLTLVVAIPGVLFDGRRVLAGAGEGWHHVVLASIEQGLSGLENLSLIPGSVGGAPIQNIGAYGAELESVFVSLTAVDRESLESTTFSRADCEFDYRDSIFKHGARDRFVITGVTLELSETFDANLEYSELRESLSGIDALTPAIVSQRVCEIRRGKLPDPEHIGNVGSFFKNPVVSDVRLAELLGENPGLPHWPIAGGGAKLAAGWLIDQCGLRGMSNGGATVYERHALVITNAGDATPDGVLGLADEITRAVEWRFDLRLEIEPQLIG